MANSSTSIKMAFQSLSFVILGNLIFTSYSPMEPIFKARYNLTSTELGIITSFIFLGSMSMALLTGFFVDRIGRKNSIKISFLILSIGSIIISIFHSYYSIIIGYYILGFGYGIITPATNSLIMKAYYPEHSRFMGIKQSGVPVGAAFSAIVLPVIAIRFSIEILYFVIFILGIIIFILVKSDKIIRQKRIKEPYIKQLWSMKKNKLLIYVSLSAISLSLGQQTLLTYYVVFAKYKGFSLISGEILLACVFIGAVIGRIMWLRLNEKLFNKNRAVMLSFIMFLTTLSFLFLIFFVKILFLMIILSIFSGICAIGWNGMYVTLISEMSSEGNVGLFSGFSMMIMTIGPFFGVPLLGLLLDYTNYFYLWSIMALIMLIAAIFIFLIRHSFDNNRLTIYKKGL